MTESKARLKPWLLTLINGGKVGGLVWLKKEEGIFKIPWKHGSKQGYDAAKYGHIFKEWAIHTGRFRENVDKEDYVVWKTRLRCAINRSTDIQEIKEQSNTSGPDPYRVFKFISSSTDKRKVDIRAGQPNSFGDTSSLSRAGQPASSGDSLSHDSTYQSMTEMDEPTSHTSSNSSSLPTFVEAAVDENSAENKEDSGIALTNANETSMDTDRSNHIAEQPHQLLPADDSNKYTIIELTPYSNVTSASPHSSLYTFDALSIDGSGPPSGSNRFSPYQRLRERRHTSGDDVLDLSSEAGRGGITNRGIVKPVPLHGGITSPDNTQHVFSQEHHTYNLPEQLSSSPRSRPMPSASAQLSSSLAAMEIPATNFVRNTENEMHIEIVYLGRKVTVTHAQNGCFLYHGESASHAELEKALGKSDCLKVEMPQYQQHIDPSLHATCHHIFGGMTKYGLSLECDRGNIFVTRLCKTSLFFVSEISPEPRKIQRGEDGIPLRALIYNFNTQYLEQFKQTPDRRLDPAVYIHVGAPKRYGEQGFIVIKVVPCRAFTNSDCCS